MRNKREAEPGFYDMLIDIQVSNVYSTKPPRISTHTCRVTPKRIYTAGGAVFSREGGHEVIARKYMTGSDYSRRALLETLRPEKERATSPLP